MSNVRNPRVLATLVSIACAAALAGVSCSNSAPGAAASSGAGAPGSGASATTTGSAAGNVDTAGSGGGTSTGASAGAAGAGASTSAGAGVGNGSGGGVASAPEDAAGGDALLAFDAGPAGDANGDAGGPESASPAQHFICTLILGAFQTSQWFYGGFSAGVETARWEIKSAHNNWTEKWADPQNAIWNLPTTSPCATGAATPDRVLLIVYKNMFGPPIPPTVWEPEITKDVQNIKTKYPSARRIELLTEVRAPNNQPCPGNSSRNIVIAPEIDAAIQSVADKSGGLIQVGPKYYVPDCSLFMTNITTLVDGGGAKVAPQLVEYYKTHS
ncbi:MAG TPA: hypothetical protein VGY54_02525 [Polyangiaceae bacterium]|nr:hypothetical protein [Polyangiaceae bacterium]